MKVTVKGTRVERMKEVGMDLRCLFESDSKGYGSKQQENFHSCCLSSFPAAWTRL